jgi:hypothetical protein
MVLTKSELIGSLRHEVHVLRHLASKIDRAKLDYRPTPKQRSTIELLRYLTIMGPGLVDVANAGKFDPAAWTALEKSADDLSFDEVLAAITTHADTYTSMIGGMSDAHLREEIAPFGWKSSRGAFITNLVLCGCAAYRMQLFLYLKACGREELSTINLWAGSDPPTKN